MITRSISATGPNNWRDISRTSNYQLLHTHRHGRNSQQELNEDTELIPKEFTDKIFQAIEDEDRLKLLCIMHQFERIGIPKKKIREWFIKKAKKNNQTTLIAACCKGNLEIVKFIIDYMFIGPQNLMEEKYIHRQCSIASNFDNSMTTLDSSSGRDCSVPGPSSNANGYMSPVDGNQSAPPMSSSLQMLSIKRKLQNNNNNNNSGYQSTHADFDYLQNWNSQVDLSNPNNEIDRIDEHELLDENDELRSEGLFNPTSTNTFKTVGPQRNLNNYSFSSSSTHHVDFEMGITIDEELEDLDNNDSSEIEEISERSGKHTLASIRDRPEMNGLPSSSENSEDEISHENSSSSRTYETPNNNNNSRFESLRLKNRSRAKRPLRRGVFKLNSTPQIQRVQTSNSISEHPDESSYISTPRRNSNSLNSPLNEDTSNPLRRSKNIDLNRTNTSLNTSNSIIDENSQTGNTQDSAYVTQCHVTFDESSESTGQDSVLAQLRDYQRQDYVNNSGDYSQSKSSGTRRKSLIKRSRWNSAAKRNTKYIPLLQSFLEVRGIIKCDDDYIEGASGLWAAASFGYNKICEYLIEKGAEVHTRTNAGSTPLRCACYDGHLETVKLLVSNGADIEAANKHGHNCLMIACYRSQIEVVKYLIDKGVNINVKSNKGSTALHDAAEDAGGLEIFKILLESGAKLDIKCQRGQTALITAASSGNRKVIDYVEREYLVTLVEEHKSRAEKTIKNPENLDLHSQKIMLQEQLDELKEVTRNLKWIQGELINSKELMGCWMIDKERNLRLGLNLWRESLNLRNRYNLPKLNNGRNAVAKTITSIKSMIKSFGWDENVDCPIKDVFPEVNEFNSLENLVNLYQDNGQVRLQSQMVRFRILGPDHPDCTMYMRTNGARFADHGDWYKCCKIWLTAMILHLKHRDPICMATLQHFIASIQLFQHMLVTSIVSPGVNHLDFRDVICTVEGAFFECQRWYKNKIYCLDDMDAPEDRANKMLRYALIVTNFAILCLQPDMRQHVTNVDDPNLLKRLETCISLQKDLKSPDGPSLLHMAASEPIKFNRTRLDGIQRDTTDDEEDWFSMNNLDANTANLFKKWLRLPGLELVRFLISCGHDVQILDHEMNTPLHLACRQRASANLITLLVKSGINPFQENKYGKTSHYYLKRALLLKEVNSRHFYDDGDRVTLNGEARARSTISSTVNRYSAAKEQISNHGTLNFLLKHRSLKSLAASAVSEYVQGLAVEKQEYELNSAFKKMDMKTDDNELFYQNQSNVDQKLETKNSIDPQATFVQSLDRNLAPHLKDFLFTHCYQIKTLYNEWQYMQTSQALMNNEHNFETTNQGIVTEFTKMRRESMGNTMENSLSIDTQAMVDDSIFDGLIE